MSDYNDAKLAAQLYIDYLEMFAQKRRGNFPPESKPSPPTKYMGQPPATESETNDDEQPG